MHDKIGESGSLIG